MGKKSMCLHYAVSNLTEQTVDPKQDKIPMFDLSRPKSGDLIYILLPTTGDTDIYLL